MSHKSYDSEDETVFRDLLEEKGKISNQQLDLTILDYPRIHKFWGSVDTKHPLKSFSPRHFAAHWWQKVYDELGIKTEVPLLPELTEEQVDALEEYRLMLVWIPEIEEKDFPSSFVKPNWTQYLEEGDIERRPLKGQWVAIETITKPNWEDKKYPEDALMKALKRKTRFNTSWDALHQGGLLAKIAEEMGFSKEKLLLPTAEQWNFVGNLFNWLRENRSMELPDLGSTPSWERCENAYESDEFRLLVGGSGDGGLAGVSMYWSGGSSDVIGFRVLAVL